jgi:hypothetical protein
MGVVLPIAVLERQIRQVEGFDVEVRHADGTTAHGNTLLGNLRREYD